MGMCMSCDEYVYVVSECVCVVAGDAHQSDHSCLLIHLLVFAALLSLPCRVVSSFLSIASPIS